MSALLGPRLMTDVQEVCLGDLEGNQGVTPLIVSELFWTRQHQFTNMHRWLAEDGKKGPYEPPYPFVTSTWPLAPKSETR
jgi:hypothetical protein